MSAALTASIKAKALDLGFELIGIAPVEPVPELDFYRDWIESGYAGEMKYLQNNIDKRTDIRELEPAAKSVVVCGKVYHADYPLSTDQQEPSKGWISRYSWGDDYHEILKKRLHSLREFIENESPEICKNRVYIDTGPVVDRVQAKYAGIGWFGKNTCLINQQQGSWFFIGEIITSLELVTDPVHPDRCGSCQRCIDACPTDAILEPYVLDSRLCISYLTIELRDEVPVGLRSQMGSHVFGCDICQDVCPWNRKATVTEDQEFQPREGLFNPKLEDLAAMTLTDFQETFRKNPVKRTKYSGLMRNVAVAMGNSGDHKFIPQLQQMSHSTDKMISEHAEWALQELKA